MKPNFRYLFSNLNYFASVLIGRLPVAMAPYQKSGFIGLCAMYSYIIYPSMVNMQHFVFELRLLQCLANKRPCIVTMATRSK